MKEINNFKKNYTVFSKWKYSQKISWESFGLCKKWFSQ